MADFSTLIASIEATIKENGVQAITGQVLQDELLLMVNAINQLKQDTLEGYAFYGESLPNGATRVVTQNTFFLASAGTYTINGSTITISDAGVSVIVYDCVNDEITTYALFAFDANPTSGSANAVTSGGVKSALDTKADKNGASPDLFAGFAGNLVDTRSAGTPQGPYAFRQSGGDGVDYMRRIKGKTEAFNQLVQNGNFENTTDSWIKTANINISVNNNVASVTASADGDNFVQQTLSLVVGHKYYVKVETRSTSPSDIVFYCFYGSGGDYYVLNGGSSDSFIKQRRVITCASNQYNLIRLACQSVSITNYYRNVMVIDLTLMYGAGNEPATPEAFEALHPLGYYSPASKLINNAATGIKTRGFNQWDEEWVSGYFYVDGSGYHEATSSNTLRSKNHILVLPDKDYYFLKDNGGSYYSIAFFDINKNYLSYTGNLTSPGIFHTPAACAYIKFFQQNITTYNHDICINRSDASRNGQYEPYWERTLALGLNSIACHDENNNAVVVNGLDGVGSSYDEAVVENGMVTKIIKRRGRRAYQAGDESDATLITDGTNTDYPLATPLTLTVDTPFPAFVEVDNLGTQERLPADTADNPQGGFESDSNYSVSVANLVRLLNS